MLMGNFALRDEGTLICFDGVSIGQAKDGKKEDGEDRRGPQAGKVLDLSVGRYGF